MFKFLRERRQREVLTLCEAELARTQKPYAVFATPRDLATQAALLERATAEDLAEHPTIKRLEFLHRLLEGLATGVEDSAIPAFIDEARALGLTETDGIRLLLEQQRKQALAATSPKVAEIPPPVPPAPVSAKPQAPVSATGTMRRGRGMRTERLRAPTHGRTTARPFTTVITRGNTTNPIRIDQRPLTSGSITSSAPITSLACFRRAECVRILNRRRLSRTCGGNTRTRRVPLLICSRGSASRRTRSVVLIPCLSGERSY